LEEDTRNERDAVETEVETAEALETVKTEARKPAANGRNFLDERDRRERNMELEIN
jgi:hypothetical protein